MKQCLTLISLLPLAVDVLKMPGGLDVVKEGVGRQLMSPQGRRDDVDEMVSNKCIHKKINHCLLTFICPAKFTGTQY